MAKLGMHWSYTDINLILTQTAASSVGDNLSDRLICSVQFYVFVYVPICTKHLQRLIHFCFEYFVFPSLPSTYLHYLCGLIKFVCTRLSRNNDLTSKLLVYNYHYFNNKCQFSKMCYILFCKVRKAMFKSSLLCFTHKRMIPVSSTLWDIQLIN